MKEHPILFTGAMVRAILEGRKTQTRRPVKAPKGSTIATFKVKIGGDWQGEEPRSVDLVATDRNGHVVDIVGIKPPFAVGDRIWVRETWTVPPGSTARVEVVYRADDEELPGPWTPSIHMPRWASRITLEVKDIRPERVQDIPQSDALAEGIEHRPAKGMSPGGSGTFHAGESHHASTAKEAFACLWDGIYGKGPLAWAHNPWTWATTFKVVTP
jgi:hypothetical protein